MKAQTIIRRILLFVPVALIHLIHALWAWGRIMILYVRYGGENIIYRKGDQKMIYDIYRALTDKK